MPAKNSESVAIKVDSLAKNFLLPHQRSQTIKSAFTGIFRSKSDRSEVQEALRDISFSVMQGEFFGIVGRNGSGKSTLLKLLAGIYTPTKGSVSVEGKLVPFIELGVGFDPELTGRENVFLNGALLGFSKKEIDARYDEIVQFAELERFMDQKLKNYSSGMQVRLAFSVAIKAEADILLVDEVLAVGDADFQRKCFEYFKKLKRDEKTVVFISHDMQAIREYCDRAMLIEQGNVVEMGDVHKVSQSYTRLFIDDGEDDAYENAPKMWGRGGVTYEPPKISVNDEAVMVETSVTVSDVVNDLVLGFTVSSLDGEDVMGSNTRIKDRIIKQAKLGDTYALKWEFPNILEDGRYTIALTAHGTSGLPVYQWWDKAASFKVRKYEKTGYQVNPDIALSLRRV